MTSDEGIKWELAKFSWEAGDGLSLSERLSLMFIIRTRVGLAGDWLREIEIARNQANIGSYWHIDIRDPKFTDVLQIVDSVYDGSRTDNLTAGGLYWSLPDQKPWFENKEVVAKVGQIQIWK